MQLKDFDFELPKELIAQFPNEKRDHSNLLIAMNNVSPKIVKFFDIIDLLHEGDVLVLNDSKVINAALLFEKNGKQIKVNLNRKIDNKDDLWSCFAKPAKKLLIGDRFDFGDGNIIHVVNKFSDGEIYLLFELKIDFYQFLEKYGKIPLPPYIKRDVTSNDLDIDKLRYQNIYANGAGSVAAPTAGLHFSKNLLDKIKDKKIDVLFITLHIGAGTFIPVKTEYINEHKMHPEYCILDPHVAEKINFAKKENRRIIAVGTTVVRTLESCVDKISGALIPKEINTNIFITPGYKFSVVDAMITNFHLPKSTLFMLICAFGEINRVKKIYEYAINKKLKFFSYGDSLFIERKNYES